MGEYQKEPSWFTLEVINTSSFSYAYVMIMFTWSYASLRRIQNSLWKMFCKLIPSLWVSRSSRPYVRYSGHLIFEKLSACVLNGHWIKIPPWLCALALAKGNLWLSSGPTSRVLLTELMTLWLAKICVLICRTSQYQSHIRDRYFGYPLIGP